MIKHKSTKSRRVEQGEEYENCSVLFEGFVQEETKTRNAEAKRETKNKHGNRNPRKTNATKRERSQIESKFGRGTRREEHGNVDVFVRGRGAGRKENEERRNQTRKKQTRTKMRKQTRHKKDTSRNK